MHSPVTGEAGGNEACICHMALEKGEVVRFRVVPAGSEAAAGAMQWLPARWFSRAHRLQADTSTMSHVASLCPAPSYHPGILLIEVDLLVKGESNIFEGRKAFPPNAIQHALCLGHTNVSWR